MEVAVSYVGFGRRLLATIIDALILLSLVPLIYLLVSTTIPGSGDAQIGAFWNFFLWGFAISIYFIVFWTWRGQTPGKMIMKIKVVRNDGSPLGLGKAVLRYVGLVAPIIVMLIGCIITMLVVSSNVGGGILLYIGIPSGPALVFVFSLSIIWDDRKQGLHDKIARTCVVRAGAPARD